MRSSKALFAVVNFGCAAGYGMQQVKDPNPLSPLIVADCGLCQKLGTFECIPASLRGGNMFECRCRYGYRPITAEVQTNSAAPPARIRAVNAELQRCDATCLLLHNTKDCSQPRDLLCAGGQVMGCNKKMCCTHGAQANQPAPVVKKTPARAERWEDLRPLGFALNWEDMEDNVHDIAYNMANAAGLRFEYAADLVRFKALKVCTAEFHVCLDKQHNWPRAKREAPSQRKAKTKSINPSRHSYILATFQVKVGAGGVLRGSDIDTKIDDCLETQECGLREHYVCKRGVFGDTTATADGECMEWLTTQWNRGHGLNSRSAHVESWASDGFNSMGSGFGDGLRFLAGGSLSGGRGVMVILGLLALLSLCIYVIFRTYQDHGKDKKQGKKIGERQDSMSARLSWSGPSILRRTTQPAAYTAQAFLRDYKKGMEATGDRRYSQDSGPMGRQHTEDQQGEHGDPGSTMVHVQLFEGEQPKSQYGKGAFVSSVGYQDHQSQHTGSSGHESAHWFRPAESQSKSQYSTGRSGDDYRQTREAPDSPAREYRQPESPTAGSPKMAFGSPFASKVGRQSPVPGKTRSQSPRPNERPRPKGLMSSSGGRQSPGSPRGRRGSVRPDVDSPGRSPGPGNRQSPTAGRKARSGFPRSPRAGRVSPKGGHRRNPFARGDSFQQGADADDEDGPMRAAKLAQPQKAKGIQFRDVGDVPPSPRSVPGCRDMTGGSEASIQNHLSHGHSTHNLFGLIGGRQTSQQSQVQSSATAKRSGAKGEEEHTPHEPDDQPQAYEIYIKRTPGEKLGVTWHNHTVVHSIVKGSPAERQGLGKFIGYRATHVNGIPVRTLGNIQQRVQGHKDIRFILVKDSRSSHGNGTL